MRHVSSPERIVIIDGGALGSEEPFAPLPNFWSDQHGTKLQWVGHAPTWEEIELESAGDSEFVARYRMAGELLGVLAVRQPHACATARRQLDQALRVRVEAGALSQ